MAIVRVQVADDRPEERTARVVTVAGPDSPRSIRVRDALPELAEQGRTVPDASATAEPSRHPGRNT